MVVESVVVVVDDNNDMFFLNQNHSDDPDCDALMRAKEMLSKEDKRGLDSAKPLL